MQIENSKIRAAKTQEGRAQSSTPSPATYKSPCLRVFENKLLRIFRPEVEKVTKGLENSTFQYLHDSSNRLLVRAINQGKTDEWDTQNLCGKTEF
jgi:hypothetical protein